jgi:hypothetical protein
MENETRNDPARTPKRPEYEPPQVEEVLSADDLAREVHYAGVVPVSDGFG